MPSSRFPQRDLTHRTGGPAVNAPSDGLEGAYSATLHTAPSGGVCKVVIPALSLTDYRSAFCSQAFTGLQGDTVLVMFDENKEPWVISPTSIDPQRLWTTGDLKPTATSAIQVGWLVCDGSAVSRTAYAALFTALGTTWGAGDGSTTFNLPDLRGRTPLGAGTGPALTARTLGQVGGEEAHLLTASESGLPAHAHTYPDHPNFAGFGQASPISGNAVGSLSTGTTSTAGPANASAAHNNMQPFAVVNYLIKT